jgi:hypothetical protein
MLRPRSPRPESIAFRGSSDCWDDDADEDEEEEDSCGCLAFAVAVASLVVSSVSLLPPALAIVLEKPPPKPSTSWGSIKIE